MEIIAHFKYNRVILSIAFTAVCKDKIQARRPFLENLTYNFPGFPNDTWRSLPATPERYFFFKPEQERRTIIWRTIRPTRLSLVIGNELPSARRHGGNRWRVSRCLLSEPLSRVSRSLLVESVSRAESEFEFPEERRVS